MVLLLVMVLDLQEEDVDVLVVILVVLEVVVLVELCEVECLVLPVVQAVVSKNLLVAQLVLVLMVALPLVADLVVDLEQLFGLPKLLATVIVALLARALPASVSALRTNSNES